MPRDPLADPRTGDEIARLSWVFRVVGRPRPDRVLYVSRCGDQHLNSTVSASLREWRELARGCEIVVSA